MKRRCCFSFIILLAFFTIAGPAWAQVKPVGTNTLPLGQLTPAPMPTGPATQNLTGRVETTLGPLSGAVVRVPRFNKMCVTNSEGGFFLTVPADAGPLAAVVTYPGCTEVNTTFQPGGEPAVVQLLPPITTKANGKQLKVYMKTARREVKRSLRKLK